MINIRYNVSQAVLSLRADGTCKMSSLKRKAESLCGRKDLDAQTSRTLVQNVKSLEEEWKGVLQSAQELHRFASTYYYYESGSFLDQDAI